MLKSFRTVAVLGAGIMGSQIAAHLANAGLMVHLLDRPSEGEYKNKGVEAAFKRALKLSPPIFFSEKVARRAKSEAVEGHTVTLKLKTKDFKSRTRSQSLQDATQLAHRIYDVAHPLLLKEAVGPVFRLIGVGISNLQLATHEDYQTLDVKQTAQTKAELAIDAIRNKFGKDAVEKGLGLRRKE